MTAALSRVCVIGAGISGLVVAKVLRNDGFDVRRGLWVVTAGNGCGGVVR